MRTVSASVLALVLALCAGCAGSSAGSNAASAELTTARAQFEELTQHDQAAVQALTAVTSNQTSTYPQIQAAFRSYSSALKSEVTTLRTTAWPSAVAPSMVRLSAAIEAEQKAASAVSKAKSKAEAGQLLSSLKSVFAAQVLGPTNVARLALGLPPVVHVTASPATT